MYNGNTISLKTILWRVMNLPSMGDLLFEDAAEYAVEAIRLIGAPLSYIDKVSPLISINQYKAALPDNMIELKGVRIINDEDNYENNPIALTRATNTFHTSVNCIDINDCPTAYTYTASGGVIKTSFKEGNIQVAYSSLPLDDEGYPLIPDNEKVKLAIRYYIMFMHMEPLKLIGKVTNDAFNYVDQKKCFYMGAASSDMKIANIDHVEAIVNTIGRIIMNRNGHKNSFKGAGTQEVFKKYN